MQELNGFKKNINLAEFSTNFGYLKNKDKSSTNAPVMCHPNGDKIVVGKDRADGHYIYFNPSNNSDKGTILDFLKHRTKQNLGEIRKTCRAWLHNPRTIEKIPVYASTKDTQKIVNLWSRLPSDAVNLTNFRGIDYQTMAWLGESGRAKYDQKEEALYFVLSDLGGICGIEKRTADNKRIIEGSTKGVFTIGKLAEAERIVVFESPIDMLSYKSLKKGGISDFYVCTMGSIGESAELSLKAIFKYSTAQIVLALDNDEGGKKIADKIGTITTRQMTREVPLNKDWNEDLNAKKQVQRQKNGFGMKR